MEKQISLVLLLICCQLTPMIDGIKIAAYNVRVFGASKLGNQVAMDMITQIVRQYDIIVIQEVRGVNIDVPGGILTRVNQAGNDYAICNSQPYTFKPSSSSHREMYLFLYRNATVNCIGTDESEIVNPAFSAAFRRPPTVGRFRTIIGNRDFFVAGIHTQPSRAVTEINSLVDVYNTFRQFYNLDLGFIMGDYNYGGTYVPQAQLDMLNIDNNPPFLRLIDKTTGTTVKPFEPTTQKKPYDRIYVAPQTIQPDITAVGVDTFRDMLDEPTYFKTVSDHYPVYVDVNFGGSGGSNPSGFDVTIEELNAALVEECAAVIEDYDPLLDDDLETDFYNFCTETCSISSIKRSTELSAECLFDGSSVILAASTMVVILSTLIGMLLMY